MNKPYIGITGFTSAVEVRKVIAGMPRKSSHLLMVGILVSQKSISGGDVKYPKRNPSLRRIASICLPDKRLLNLIHYHAKEQVRLSEQLGLLMEAAGENCHGFQLNMAWPDPKELESFRKEYAGKKIILQIGRGAIKKMDNSPIRVANKVEEYDGLADYLLLDGSGGEGVALNPDISKNYLFYLSKIKAKINLGLAGGLGPDSLDLLKTILPDFPGLSINAEGNVRNKLTDVLSTRKGRKYLIRALDMMSAKA